MPIERVGHVVLKMRDLDKAKQFYGGVLGMQIADDEDFGVFFRFNDYHHDIAVFKVPDDAELPKEDQVGLAHVALVTDSLETVKEMYLRLKEQGVEVTGTADHGVTKSLYCKDPEGNEIEIYCEVPEVSWQDAGTVAIDDPLDLESVKA